MKFKYLILLLIGFISCETKEIQTISVEELTVILSNNNVQLVDVRTPEEFKLGHITNAELIDVKTSNFESIALEKLDKNKPVYMYCRSGKRGRKACDILQKKGFKVYNLEGGYLNWKSKKE